MNIDEVLDEYRKGDADKRIGLFLYYRELRDAFERVEQNDPLELFPVRKEPRSVELQSFRAYFGMLRERISRL
jgi:hypothetical protein